MKNGSGDKMEIRNLPEFCTRYLQNKRFRCVSCGKEFKSKKLILIHLSNNRQHQAESPQQHTCACGQSFDKDEEFTQHLNDSNVHISSLHLASCQGNIKQSKKLCRFTSCLDRKCRSHDVNDSEDPSCIGATPLHCAILNRFNRCAKILLKWGADPNAKDEFGWTPVHIATARGCLKTILMLITYNGNIFDVNNDGQTPFDIASTETKKEFLEALFTFEEKDGSCVPTGMKNSRLASLVIKQLKDFENKTSDAATPTLNPNIANSMCIKEREDDVGGDMKETGEVSIHRSFDYTDLLENEATKKTYSHFVNHGKEEIIHGRITVLGPVGSGKTSLVRNLSGKDFIAERVETEGIESSFVETISLNQSWQVEDDLGWKFDEAVARHLTEWILKKLAKSASIVEGTQQLSLCDSFESSPVGPCSLHQGQVNQSLVVPASIDEPVKKKIIEKLERKSDLTTTQFKFSILDFAGHDCYQSMHHIFLSAKSVYVLCVSLVDFGEDRNKVVEELNYWLNSIASHKSKSEPAVFVVATHVDSVPETAFIDANKFIMEKIFDKFSNFFVLTMDNQLAFPVDNTKGPNSDYIKALQTAITKEAESCKECMHDISIKWLMCEKELHRMVHEDSSLFSKTKKELFEDLCQSHPNASFDDEDFQDMLIKFHDSGILWLPERVLEGRHSTADTNDLVILNIQHLMDAMKAVCQLCCDPRTVKDRHHRKIANLLNSDAKVSLKNLEDILKDCSAPTDTIVKLLEIFNIMLPAEGINLTSSNNNLEFNPEFASTPKRSTSEADEHYIIPSLLQNQRLDDMWKEVCKQIEEHYFYIDFFEFVSQAFFHHFVIKVACCAVDCGSFQPILRKSDGIFGLDHKFTFRLEFQESLCQVKGSLRADYKDEPGLLILKLKGILVDICDNFFRFQRFKIGPACPLGTCSNPDGSAMKRNRSGYNDATDGEARQNFRPFVIDFNPEEFRPIYCSTDRVDSHEDVQRWALSRSVSSTDPLIEDTSGREKSNSIHSNSSVDPKMVKIDRKIILNLSSRLGDCWKNLARYLFKKDTDIEARIQMIKAENQGSLQEWAYQLMNKWTQEAGDEATVGCLYEALVECGRSDLANDVLKFYSLD